MSAPVVAIIGRPNVGKSTFFNRVLGERRAVVHDRPGHHARPQRRARRVGGAHVRAGRHRRLPAGRGRGARRRGARARPRPRSGSRDVVIFMVDAHDRRHRSRRRDRARSLRRTGAHCLLVVNKVDKPGDPIVHEFHRLGLGEPIADLVRERLRHRRPARPVLAAAAARAASRRGARRARVAIIGRPNVGKSSIVNALLGEERMVVEPTRRHDDGRDRRALEDAARASSCWSTPPASGARRSSTTRPSSTPRCARSHALERADVACLVVDATQGFQRAGGAARAARARRRLLAARCSTTSGTSIEDREQAWKDAAGRARAALSRRSPTCRDPALGDRGHAPRRGCRRRSSSAWPSTRASIPTSRAQRLAARRCSAAARCPARGSGESRSIYYMTQTGTRPPEFTLFVNAPVAPDRELPALPVARTSPSTFGFHGTPVRLRGAEERVSDVSA